MIAQASLFSKTKECYVVSARKTVALKSKASQPHKASLPFKKLSLYPDKSVPCSLKNAFKPATVHELVGSFIGETSSFEASIIETQHLCRTLQCRNFRLDSLPRTSYQDKFC